MEDDKNIANLKMVDEDTVEITTQFQNIKRSKEYILRICESLDKESRDYKTSTTVKLVDEYLANQFVGRLLYSEISGYIYSLDIPQQGAFATNAESLLDYVMKDSNAISDDTKKLIIKIYDHFQLAWKQIENIENICAKGLVGAKLDLKEEIKIVEKEYVTILGIFAAIVLAFVSGITFSTSVLQNIASVSIYRLCLVTVLIGFVLTNVIHLLIHFIMEINGKEDRMSQKVNKVNKIFFLVAVAIIVGWLLSIDMIPHVILKFLRNYGI